MSGPQPPALQLTEKQQALLQQFAHRKTLSAQLVQRSQLILALATGANHSQVARQLGLTRGTVRSWRQRWLSVALTLKTAEGDAEQQALLPEMLAAVLSDQPRPGAPAVFEPEQIVQIIALACEPPGDSGRPVTHWTPTELAQEAVKRGIVPRISARSVGRFLGRGRTQTPSFPLLAQCQASRSGGVHSAGQDDLRSVCASHALAGTGQTSGE